MAVEQLVVGGHEGTLWSNVDFVILIVVVTE